jgi:plastocyanin domain-containing protein
MSLDKIVVTIAGLSLIPFIYWFFFGKKEEKSSTLTSSKKYNKGNLTADIVVDGGYKPAIIFLEKGRKITLRIIRKDANTCLSDIILPDFKVSKYLPMDKEVQIELNPETSGEFPFHCGMNMFHGKIVVD